MKKPMLLIALLLPVVVACGGQGWEQNPLESLCSNKDLGLAVGCLNALPKEDILAIPEVKSYLSEHKVYVSLTTSPKRLKELPLVLKTIDLEHVEKVFLTLPEKYQNKEEYDEIPEEVLKFPKLVRIGQGKKDIGPATKMLYALELVGEWDKDALVISIDDDTGLPMGAIGQLIKYAALNPNAVVGGSGHYASLFGVDNDHEWPKDGMTNKKPYCGKGEISYCHILEGYKGIAYRPRLVNTDKIAELSAVSKQCLTSDDLVISYVLALDGVERIRISNPYFNQVNQFTYGFEADALQRIPSKKLEFADGWKSRFSWAAQVGVAETSVRYQRCAYELSQLPKVAQ